jgi:hypothetical protein
MNDKAHAIFASARMYSKAAHVLNGTANSDRPMLIPSMVNAALALELYFKSLYVLEHKTDFKIKGRHSHDFSAAFEELAGSTKQEFIEGFTNALAVRDMNDVNIVERDFGMRIPRDLKTNLVEWSSVFTGVRYIYEFQFKPAGSQKT